MEDLLGASGGSQGVPFWSRDLIAEGLDVLKAPEEVKNEAGADHATPEADPNQREVGDDTKDHRAPSCRGLYYSN